MSTAPRALPGRSPDHFRPSAAWTTLALASLLSPVSDARAFVQAPDRPLPTDIRPPPQSGELETVLPQPRQAEAPAEVTSSESIQIAVRGAKAVDWERLFPRVIADPGTGETRPAGCSRGTKYLDLAWLVSCFGPSGASIAGRDGQAAETLRIVGGRMALYAGVERANIVFFEEGYVNSGILVSTDPTVPGGIVLEVVAGRLGRLRGKEFVDCRIERPGSQYRLHHYAERRMLRGCRADRPFNLYRLERDFRRLADDSERWIAQVNYRVEPLAGPIPGLATLEPLEIDPSSEGAAGPAGARDEDPARPISARPLVSMVAGVANDRSPSIGSIRSFAGATLRWPAGFLLAGEVGRTEGGIDGNATARWALAPRWSGEVRADANEAEIVDPLLRSLDIRSRGWGVDGALLFGAVSCPLTPLYAATQSSVPRRAYSLDGIDRCRLSGRFIGDVPTAWSAARELEFGLSVSHRESRSFLFGEPFSFSPGAVDGRSHVTALRATVNWLQRGRAGIGGPRGWTLAARVQASFGLDGSASDIAGLAAPPRHFTVIRAEAGYARQLSLGTLVLTGRLTAQWTADLLYTAERLPVGGFNSVRGYPEAVLLADRGLIGSIEISRLFSLTGRRPVHSPATDDPGQIRLSLFADGAVASSLNPAARFDETLGSVGAGIAWLPNSWLEASAQYGRRLGRDLAGPSPALANDGIHLSLRIWPLRLLGLEGD